MNNEQLLDFCMWLQANFDAIMKMDMTPASTKIKEKVANTSTQDQTWGEPVSEEYWRPLKRRSWL